MSVRPWSRIVGVSALVFVVVLGDLTVPQAWNFESLTAVQSLVVDAGVVLVIVGVAAHAARGENIGAHADEGIVSTFGPCLDFAANLFIPTSTMELPLWVAYPLVAGAAPAPTIDGVGTAAGYVVRVVRKNGTVIGRTS